MPFPLAHPAAVLPLRRFCPRYLSFSALIIGSLSPDLGYFSGPLRLDDFSHRLFAGAFGFCLPAGLLVFLIFHLLGPRALRILPARYRAALLPICLRPLGSPLPIVVSLLIGSWSHLLLDALTHPDDWLLRYLPFLKNAVLNWGRHRFTMADLLYAGVTFSGVAWLAMSYLLWMERSAGSRMPIAAASKWARALLLASAVLFIAESSRGASHSLTILSGGILTLLLVVAFLWTGEK